MTQILKSLQLVTSSTTPGTPPSEFGVIYASGSNNLFYKNPSGNEFNLSIPNGYIDIRYYTGSAIDDGTTQTYIWSKPPTGLKYIEVCCVGAGGGGGSGHKRISPGSNPSQGGLGGSGGAIAWGTFDASILSSSYTIVIGAGGAGGVGQTTANSNGLSGSNGGTSSFGNLVIAASGRGGIGGQSVSTQRTQGGLATQCTPSGYPHAYTGCVSAPIFNVPSNPVFNAPPIFNNIIETSDVGDFAIAPTRPGYGGGGGGSGGSYNAGGTRTSGSRGSNGYQFTTLITNGGFPGSASNGQNATAPTNNMITTLLQFTGSTTLYGLGGGGHGGAAAVAPFNGGQGSNGGLYGAGGGGGGSINYNTALSASGAGGSGSSGLCIVVEFY